MKVAINQEYGGFGLSEKAYRELGLNWDSYGYAYNNKEKRTDSKLIEVIEKLGNEASGPLACVAVVEIPDGIAWTIEEYDGVEWIAEKHQTWP